MTENKRFHFDYVLGDTGLIDEQAEHKWFIENCCSGSDLKKNWITVCNKLNELAEENEQLKNTIGHNYEEHKRIVNNYVDKIKEVEKENEHLKQFQIKLDNRIQKLKEDLEKLTEMDKSDLNPQAVEDVATVIGISLNALMGFRKELKGNVE